MNDALASGRIAGSPLRLWRARSLEAGSVARARALGFGHVVLPLSPTRGGAALLAGPPEAPLAVLADARAAGLGVVLEVILDRVAAGAFAGADAAPFDEPRPEAARDPRHATDPEAAVAAPASRTEAMGLAGWWGARLAPLAAAGVGGFVLRGLAAVKPDFLPALLSGLRLALPGSLLLVWAPGLSRAAMRALAGTGIDGSFASLAWWDFDAAWLAEEVEVLREAGPVLGAPLVTPAIAPMGAASAEATGELSARSLVTAAAMGGGWMLQEAPAGASRLGTAPAGASQVGTAPAGAAAMIAAINGVLSAEPALGEGSAPIPLAGEAGPVFATLHLDRADRQQARHGVLAVVNGDAARTRTLEVGVVLPVVGGVLGAFTSVLPPDAPPLVPGQTLILAPGEARLYVAGPAPRPVAPAPVAAREAAGWPRLAIEAISPAVDDGAFAVKRIAGESVRVHADVVFDGHDMVAASLRWRAPGDEAWTEAPMRPLGNDRWTGEFPLTVLGRHLFEVQAWKDRFATFRDELGRKHAAGLNLSLELEEGAALLREAEAREPALPALLARFEAGSAEARRELLLSDEVAAAMVAADARPHLARSSPMPVEAERIGARYASWYEIFPRSMSDDERRHGTFADVHKHLPRIHAMGFDVLYFPPIHPIGRKNRKGRNNTLTPAADDPGSPYAIGSDEGGHDALHPALGSLDDLRALREAAAALGIELAIDFAVQCSPDHPWLAQHPEWFDWRPDGTIRYAENPPKKYEDIVNVDFYAAGAVPGLWRALADVVLFWAAQGIRLFRVDNPHTKPFPFWEWMIAEVKRQYPDAIFLAEAFTRPKVMYRLAKIGFSQSYTYFTWRNDKAGLTEYLTELTTTAPREFFRPHFFVNTPDINPPFLQNAGRPGFLIRAALAATLSGLWGAYCGFELCEAAAIPGREEYLDSEKYQLRAWDWDRPGNIVAEIAALNRIRRGNPALQTHLGLTFLTADNPQILYYEKAAQDRSNVVLVAVSLDPFGPQTAAIEVPLWRWGLGDNATIAVEDLVTGTISLWQGKMQHVALGPGQPYAIWRVRPV